jgi:hypothetical protein
VANARVHGETSWVPAQALMGERAALQVLPAPYRGAVAPARPVRASSSALRLQSNAFTVVPPQHDLAVYERLLEVTA